MDQEEVNTATNTLEEFFSDLDQIDLAPAPMSGEEILKNAMMMTYDDPSQPMYVVEQEAAAIEPTTVVEQTDTDSTTVEEPPATEPTTVAEPTAIEHTTVVEPTAIPPTTVSVPTYTDPISTDPATLDEPTTADRPTPATEPNAIIDVKGSLNKLIEMCGENLPYSQAFGHMIDFLTRKKARPYEMPTLLFCIDEGTKSPYVVVCSVLEALKLTNAYVENGLMRTFGQRNRLKRMEQTGREDAEITVTSQTKHYVADFVGARPRDLPTPIVTCKEEGKGQVKLRWPMAAACVYNSDGEPAPEGVRLRKEDGAVVTVALMPFSVVRICETFDVEDEEDDATTEEMRRALSSMPFCSQDGRSAYVPKKDRKRAFSCEADVLTQFPAVGHLRGALAEPTRDERPRTEAVASIKPTDESLAKKFGQCLFGRLLARAVKSAPGPEKWKSVLKVMDVSAAVASTRRKVQETSKREKTLVRKIEKETNCNVTRSVSRELDTLKSSDRVVQDLLKQLAEAREDLKKAKNDLAHLQSLFNNELQRMAQERKEFVEERMAWKKEQNEFRKMIVDVSTVLDELREEKIQKRKKEREERKINKKRKLVNKENLQEC